MPKSETFFVIEDTAKIADGGMKLAGHLILDAGINVPGGSGAQSNDDAQYRISLPKPLEVKWILPPRTSGAYGAVKAFAEGAGYDTVENDDFTYPPRPI